jgi:glycosyltransferase EpsF
MMRVLHFFGDLGSVGGAERWFLDLLRQGDSRVRFDFLVNICKDDTADEVRKYGSKIFQIPFSRSPFPYCFLNPYLLAVRRILRANEYDAVHVHQFDLAGEILRIAANENIPKRVMTVHSSQYDNTRIHRRLVHYIWGRQWIFQYATDILPCSKLVESTFIKNYPKQKTKIIYPSINTDFLKKINQQNNNLTPKNSDDTNLRNDYRRIFGIPQNAVVIGHVGRFTRQKNHEFLVRFLSEAMNRDKRIYAVLVGTGNLFGKINQIVQKAGLSERIILAGVRDDVPSMMTSLFDVLVLPSLYEGLPVVAVEALGAGLGVIYSDKITDELDQFFPLRTFRCQLKIEDWLETITKAIAAKNDPSKALTEITNSPFNIKSALQQLISVYTTPTEDSFF